MLRSPDHPLLVAGLLGVIAGAITGLLGGFILRPEPGDMQSAPAWTLDVFGVPVVGGIQNHAVAIGLALLAFAAVGAVVALSLTTFIRRRTSGASSGSLSSPHPPTEDA